MKIFILACMTMCVEACNQFSEPFLTSPVTRGSTSLSPVENKETWDSSPYKRNEGSFLDTPTKPNNPRQTIGSPPPLNNEPASPQAEPKEEGTQDIDKAITPQAPIPPREIVCKSVIVDLNQFRSSRPWIETKEIDGVLIRTTYIPMRRPRG